MCSVVHKVRKSNQWRTDVRAIRDAFSHHQYSILEVGGELQISFCNNLHGYSFTETFTQREFNKFFDLHTLLYKLQLALLSIIELLPILTTHFLTQN